MQSTASEQAVDVRAQFWGPPGPDGILGWNSGSKVPPARVSDFAEALRKSAEPRHLDCSLCIMAGGRVVWRRVGEQLTLPGVA